MAWAVGDQFNQTTNAQETFVLHWNGTRWSKVASPNPGGATSMNANNVLSGVSAESATDAWAVGAYADPTTGAGETLVLHWNGTKWSKIASPNPGGTTSSSNSDLVGVSADSATDAWAVGNYLNPTTGAGENLVLHWSGTKWSNVSSPNPGGTGTGDANALTTVSADSVTDVWAVGYYFNPTTQAQETLVLHWSGTNWSKVAGPNPGGTTSNSDFNFLEGVSADTATDAWAVGNCSTGGTLVLRWNGAKWSRA